MNSVPLFSAGGNPVYSLRSQGRRLLSCSIDLGINPSGTRNMENCQAYTTEMVISVFEDPTNPNFSGLWDYFITLRDWWPQLNFLESGRKTGILTNALQTWNSTLRTNKLAQLVYSHTRVAMVHATTAPYEEAFLYALATVWDVDSVFTLQDNIALCLCVLAPCHFLP